MFRGLCYGEKGAGSWLSHAVPMSVLLSFLPLVPQSTTQQGKGGWYWYYMPPAPAPSGTALQHACPSVQLLIFANSSACRYFWRSPNQVITDAWARCRFGATGGSGDADGGGTVEGVTVEDRASGRTLAEYSRSPASSVELDAEALGLLRPAEASSLV